MCFSVQQVGRSPRDWVGKTLGHLYMTPPHSSRKERGFCATGPSQLDISGYLIAPSYLTVPS